MLYAVTNNVTNNAITSEANSNTKQINEIKNSENLIKLSF